MPPAPDAASTTVVLPDGIENDPSNVTVWVAPRSLNSAVLVYTASATYVLAPLVRWSTRDASVHPPGTVMVGEPDDV